MQPIHFFRAGAHSSSDGRETSFSEADLRGIVSGYDPNKHEAPLVVGHPKVEAPAYGWVEGIELKSDGLYAKPRDVNPEFAELVKQGNFRKVSGSFYTPVAKGNPTPGSYHLRHIGFLGAQPPAVKGLRPIEFGDDTRDLVNFEEDVFELREHSLAFAEAAFKDRENAFRRTEAKAELTSIATAGKLPFFQIDGALAFMETLEDSETIEFSDQFAKGDGGRSRLSPRAWFLEHLCRQPSFVTLGEFAGGEMPDEADKFEAPQGYTADPEQVELRARIREYQNAMGVSFEVATRAVQRGERPRKEAK